MEVDGVLAQSTLGWSTPGNFTSLCPNGSKWVWEGLGECARDGRDMASVYLGLLSIVCFMVSSLPQYYSSCKSGNMDSALSIWFLLLWLAGDSCNLVGSYLADQLPIQVTEDTDCLSPKSVLHKSLYISKAAVNDFRLCLFILVIQRYTAIYYVVADLVMLGMYSYYKFRHKRSQSRTVLHVLSLSCVLSLTASLAHFSGLEHQPETISSGFRSRSLLSATENDSIKAFTTKEIIGFTIGSLSSVLYLCSRLPQMYTNFKRKSTEGVSYFLFALVILGNTTYGLSVLLKNPDSGQGESSYLVHHLPWLIGSLGTLSLDLIISVQFLIYRNAPVWNVNGGITAEETAPLIGS
uniref:Lysosomal amino acid transporter 1 homolog n=1 Tax=Nothobranchius furzeri TaxID=105023 RepID=A0A8C6M9M7_NOTFU